MDEGCRKTTDGYIFVLDLTVLSVVHDNSWRHESLLQVDLRQQASSSQVTDVPMKTHANGKKQHLDSIELARFLRWFVKAYTLSYIKALGWILGPAISSK
ncbi:hypothetical protein PMIN06_000141 [Paraphaeosphaeria minitans]